MNTTRLLPLGLVAVLGLSACFGGGDDDTPAPPLTQAPASIGDSPAAYTQFVRDLPASETAEPLNLDLVATAPTTEDGPPVSLD
jgi:hypothetical protein